MGLVLASVLLLADVSDEAFLAERLEGLAAAYDEQARRQSAEAIGRRVAVMREIAHLPWRGEARSAAAAFLARAIRTERTYRVRAETLRAIGAVGTRRALDATYRALFDRAGRSPRFALLYTALPGALRKLPSADDWEWIRQSVFVPAQERKSIGLRHLAAHRADEMLLVSIEAAGLAGRAELEPDFRSFAAHGDARIRAAALRALGRVDRGEDLVSAGLRDEDEDVRMAAARAPSLPWTQLQRALFDASTPVRRAALRNLGGRGEELALPSLIVALRREPEYAARRDAHTLLVRRTGEDFGLDADLWRGWHRARDARDEKDSTASTARDQASRVLFVVDVSASMSRVAVGGRTMQEQAEAALRARIARMPRSARYAAIGFASELRRFPERAAEAERVADVLVWFASLKPAGASNSYAALMQAIRDPLRPDTIIFVSDGVPRHCSWRGNTYSEPEQILHEVRDANRRSMVRIDVVGLLGGSPTEDDTIDEETAVGFLRRLAAENDGTYEELR